MERDMRLGEDWEDFFACVADIYEHPAVLRLSQYMQHAHVTRYEHSVNVAYQGYVWAKRLGLDARAAARGGMLHDLFFYDWQQKGAAPGPGCHARWHPYYALKTAQQYFTLTKKEENIIVSHMFPLGYELPRCRESFVVTWADKVCATRELAGCLMEHWSAMRLRRAAVRVTRR